MNIVMYTKSSCPNCVAAKMILQLCKLDFVEVDAELGNRWENLLKEFPDGESDRRGDLRWLEDDRISSKQRCNYWRHRQSERVVPRAYHCNHAKRLVTLPRFLMCHESR